MWRRRKMLEGLEADIREHLERETQDNIVRGMTPEEARYAARRKFGNVMRVKEEVRGVWYSEWMEQVAQDLRYGLRVLRKSPGFAAVAILTLALGIGANTAIFSLINAVMLRTLPIRDPQHLLLFRWDALHEPSTNASYFWGGCPNVSNDPDKHTPSGCTFSYPIFERMRSRQDLFSGVAGFTGASQVHWSGHGEVNMEPVQLVSGDFFSTLEVGVASGRAIEPSDDLAGAPRVVTLSYAFWQRRFGGDPSILGQTILLESTPFTIVGVTAPKFAGLDPGLPVDMWAAISSQDILAPHLPKRAAEKSLWIQMIARPKAERSVSQAEAAANVIFESSSGNGAAAIFKPGDSPRVQLLNAEHGLVSLHREFAQPLFVLMAAVGIILLMACANVAGLSMARAMAREQEMALRFSLGATRGRIVRQLLTESFLLAGAGALLGIVLAYWSSSALAAFLAANWYAPMELDVRPDATVLIFTMAAAVLAALLLGLAPALHGMRAGLLPSIKGSGNSGRRAGNLATRGFGIGSGLVVAQVALSIVVLAGAGLLVRTLVNLKTLNVGFDKDNVLLFAMDPSLTHYKGEQAPMLYRELQAHLASLPGVNSASYSMVPLLSGSGMNTEYALPKSPDQKISADVLPVGPGFFETMHMALAAGRTFEAADFDAGANPTPVVINRSLAKLLFGDDNPLGQEFTEPGEKRGRVVVGVVGDAKYTGVREAIHATAYTPFGKTFFQLGAEFEVRTSGDPQALAAAVRASVNETDPNILVSHMLTQSAQMDQTLYQERLVASLSGLFGALALLLACVGIYGLLAYEVTRRTREIGIRVALGAQRQEIRRLVTRRGLLLSVAGAAAGVACAAGLTRYLQILLYGVRPTDPWTFTGAVIVLIAVGVLACYIPARRATRVDPMVALRHE